MPKLILTIGIPASGKTHWALEQVEKTGAAVIERDELRKIRYDQGETWSKKMEEEITRQQSQLIANILGDGVDVIVSDTNINPKTRDRLKSIARNRGADYEEVIIRCDLETAKERNKNREGWKVVPDDVMKNMYINFTEQFPIKYYPHRGPAAYIFDLDGTLAQNVSGRSPYEWHRVGEDRPNDEIVSVLSALWRDEFKIIIMSGRDSVCRPETEAWLDRHFIYYDELIMRPEGNNLKDSVIKHDMMVEYIAPYYTIMGVFDDRRQTTDIFRKMGLRVFHVDWGCF